MKKIGLIVLSLMLALALVACGAEATTPTTPDAGAPQNPPVGENSPEAGSRTLVAYFSNSGNTKAVAEMIASATGGDLVEITAAEPYSAADLDSKTEGSRVNTEQADDAARPAVATNLENASNYDVVFIGYPIWLGKAPKVVNTYLESADLSGKTIIPFCTSGNSDITDSLPSLKASAMMSMWQNGMRFAAGATEAEVTGWVDSLNLDTGNAANGTNDTNGMTTNNPASNP